MDHEVDKRRIERDHQEVLSRSRRSAPSQESSSCGRIEDGCACPTWFRKDGKLSVMEDERIDPLSADNAMQRVQWYSYFLQNILQQDPTTAPALLHKIALSIPAGCPLADVPVDLVKVLLISDFRTCRQKSKVSGIISRRVAGI